MMKEGQSVRRKDRGYSFVRFDFDECGMCVNDQWDTFVRVIALFGDCNRVRMESRPNTSPSVRQSGVM